MVGWREVRIGERFKTVSQSAYGSPNGEVFEVRKVLVDGCIVPHAKLISMTNPTDHKLISVDALRDTKLYVPVEVQNSEPVDVSTD